MKSIRPGETCSTRPKSCPLHGMLKATMVLGTTSNQNEQESTSNNGKAHRSPRGCFSRPGVSLRIRMHPKCSSKR
eukprot:2467371-Amphidinium_carterae.1